VRKFLFVLGFTGVAAVVMAGAACSNSAPNDGRIDLPTRPDDAMVDSAVAPGPTDSAVSCKNLALKVGEPAACDQCAKEKCCAEVMACNSSADCKALQECIAPCAQDDLFCILTCQEAHSNGASKLQDVGACAQSSCKNECPSMQSDADIFADGGLNAD
jgi:hypothetical protein